MSSGAGAGLSCVIESGKKDWPMRELILFSFSTLDGVMQAPGGAEKDPTDGFTHGGWSFGYSESRCGVSSQIHRQSRMTSWSAARCTRRSRLIAVQRRGHCQSTQQRGQARASTRGKDLSGRSRNRASRCAQRRARTQAPGRPRTASARQRKSDPTLLEHGVVGQFGQLLLLWFGRRNT